MVEDIGTFEINDAIKVPSTFSGNIGFMGQPLLKQMTGTGVDPLKSARVPLHWSESDITSKWLPIDSNLMFTFSSDKDFKKSFSRSILLSLNKPQHHVDGYCE